MNALMQIKDTSKSDDPRSYEVIEAVTNKAQKKILRLQRDWKEKFAFDLLLVKAVNWAAAWLSGTKTIEKLSLWIIMFFFKF